MLYPNYDYEEQTIALMCVTHECYALLLALIRHVK